MPGDGVPVTADGDACVMLAGDLHRRDDVGAGAAAGDQCGPAVDVPVLDLSGGVVGRVVRLDGLAAERRLEPSDVDRGCGECSHHGRTFHMWRASSH